MHTKQRQSLLLNAIDHNEHMNSKETTTLHMPILIKGDAGTGVTSFIHDFVTHSPHPAICINGAALDNIDDIDWATLNASDPQRLGGYLVIDQYDALSDQCKTELMNTLARRERLGTSINPSLTIILISTSQGVDAYVHPLDLRTLPLNL